MSNTPEATAGASIRRPIQLVKITDLDTEAQLQLRDIRNEPSVRAVMFTDHVIGVNEHLQWLNRLKQDTTQIAFAALDEKGRPLGSGSFGDIDLVNKKATWGFYVAEKARGGLGTAMCFSLADFAFTVLGLDKLNAEVLEGNAAGLKQHKRLYFSDEGFRKSNVIKDGKRVGVHLLGLEKVTWLEQIGASQHYPTVFEQFDVQVKWTGRDKESSPIDQIEAARARNNLNWMSILRIALERAPETSKQIVSEIKGIDQEISALTQKLVE